MGLDVLCQAKAGMGKTAVFVLTTLNRMAEFPEQTEPSCLVLAHTRELAFQIAKEFDRFSQNLNFKTQVIIGGENAQDQADKLKADKPQIIVGTPGRVLSFIKKGILDSKNVKIFIIDECDKMLKELGMFYFFQKTSPLLTKNNFLPEFYLNKLHPLIKKIKPLFNFNQKKFTSTYFNFLI
jgi:ATP-dependent RNA helicase UAP56/SUB2